VLQFLRRTLLLLLVAGLALYLFRDSVLEAMGRYLVRTDPEEKADIVLVLAGDSYGDRIRTGAELVRKGLAPKVLVSGPAGIYGSHECDLAIPFAVRAGYPESYFLHGENTAKSTVEEAEQMVPKLAQLAAKHVLLVTSDFHTRRSARIFRRRAPGMQFTVIGAPGPEFSPNAWWKNRQGQKIAFNEWTKTVAEWFGI
jgi:uncharacterized SAM-binding protein YcdF (DUF218 family)